MNHSDLSKQCVNDIIADLSDRGGFFDLFDAIDSTVLSDLKRDLSEIVSKYISASHSVPVITQEVKETYGKQPWWTRLNRRGGSGGSISV